MLNKPAAAAGLNHDNILDSRDPKAAGNSPFMVGVSGHRDLAPTEHARLQDAVKTFLQELKRHLPDTELRMIVGMAAGADLLVARTALDLGVCVDAVLPMRFEEHAVDFDADTLKHLRDLWDHPAVHRITLGGGPDLTMNPACSVRRDAMYANLTETLIRRSSLLLALWDGRPSRLQGDTTDTVLRYLGIRTDESQNAGTLEFVSGSAEPDARAPLVYWTPAARINTAPLPAQRPPCFLSGAGDNVVRVHQTMPAWFKIQLEELNNYNREFRILAATGRLGIPDSLMAALPLPDALSERQTLEKVDAQYGKADALAVYYQRRSDRLFDLFTVTALIMGLAYLIYDTLNESRVLLLIYLIMLIAGLGAYYALQGRRWFGKHLMYRTLAETLRARFYLRLAGVDHRVNAAEVLALSGIERFQGFSWIAFVLKHIEPVDIGPSADPTLDCVQAGCVEHSWIDHQLQYFTMKVAWLGKRSRSVRALKLTLLIAMLTVIGALVMSGGLLDRVDVGVGVPIKNVLTFTMAVLAVLLGVWELRHKKVATRELLWQYRNQLDHLLRAKARLQRVRSPRHRNEVLAGLGEASLMESYLWAIHRYHREHEPPGA